jgi:hypothetical protein
VIQRVFEAHHQPADLAIVRHQLAVTSAAPQALGRRKRRGFIERQDEQTVREEEAALS